MAKNTKIQKIVFILIILLIIGNIHLYSQKREEAQPLYEMQDKTLYRGPVYRFFSQYNEKEDFSHLLYLIIPLFFIMVGLPFIPAIKELIQKKDAEPLFVNMAYYKDPRFFDRSFRQKLLANVSSMGTDRAFRVKLSRNEELVEVCKAENVNEYNFGNNVLYLEGNADITNTMKFKKEVYVTGTTKLNENTIIRGILSEKDLKIAPHSTIVRWAGSEANIFVGHDCDLGVRCSCEKELWLDIGCKFKSLYGHPIITRYDEHIVKLKMEQAESEPEEPRKIKKTKRENIIEFNKKNYFLNHETDENTTRLSDSPYREKYDKTTSNDEDDDLIEIADYCIVVNEKGLVVFDKDSDINNDVIIKSKALFRSGNEVHGTIKCYKDLELEDNVIIYGNLISEKNIKIGANCKIYGSVFSQGSVEIKENSVIGIAGKDKSVIGKHGIILNRNVRIHGYLLTEGEGKTV